MTTNYASGDDRVPMQVGQVLGRSKGERPDPPEVGEVAVENVRDGDARVGRQADTIEGGLTFG